MHEAEEPSGWQSTDASLIIGAERLTGVHLWQRTDVRTDDSESSMNGTTVNLLWASSFSGGGLVNPYAIPALSFHGVLPIGITLGGSLGYSVDSGEAETTFNEFGESTTLTQELPEVSIFTFSPRAGFLVRTSRWISLWLRGGVTYYSISVNDTEAQVSLTGVSISVDPMLVITPVPHVGILLGPSLDVGVHGTVDLEAGGDPLAPPSTDEPDTKRSNYAVVAGVALLF